MSSARPRGPRRPPWSSASTRVPRVGAPWASSGWRVPRSASGSRSPRGNPSRAATPAICALGWDPWVLVASSVTDALVGVGLDLVSMLFVIDIAGPARAAQYVAIGATLAGVRGILGPLLGGLLIGALGVRAVYLMAVALMTAAAWLVVREPARRVVVYSRS